MSKKGSGRKLRLWLSRVKLRPATTMYHKSDSAKPMNGCIGSKTVIYLVESLLYVGVNGVDLTIRVEQLVKDLLNY